MAKPLGPGKLTIGGIGVFDIESGNLSFDPIKTTEKVKNLEVEAEYVFHKIQFKRVDINQEPRQDAEYEIVGPKRLIK